MKYVLTALLFSLSCVAIAQSGSPDSFATFIDTADLRKHMFHIASAEMEGRETATEGQRKAAAYIEKHFKTVGLKGGWNGGYQQRFPVLRDSLVKVALNVDGNTLRHDSDFAVTNNSGFNLSLTTGEVLFVGYGRSDSARNDYSNINANGKIVLVMPGAPPEIVKGKKRPGTIPDFYSLQEAAEKNGAAALLIVDSRFPRKRSSILGPMYFEDFRKENIPNTMFISDSVARMIMGSDYDTVKKVMKTNVPSPKSYPVQLTLELAKVTEHLESSNVIGVLEGSDKKDEAIVITSHYDHLGKRDSLIYYGADDDGSGTVTILELGEAFAKAAESGARPRRTIIFMTVSGEEKGLWGSEYYSDHPAFALEKTSANVNIDMIGRIESGRKKDSLNYVYIVGDNRLSSELRPLSEAANKKYFNFTLDYKFNDPADPQRIYYRSDHYNFAKHGVPAIFYFNGLHDDYHRHTDTPDKINFSLLSKRAQLIFYTAWEIANRNEMLKRDVSE